MNPWPLYQPIQDGELFSSWLVRNALAHGCSPLAFSGVLWPGVRIWATDVDCGMKPSLLERLTSDDFPNVAVTARRFLTALNCVSNAEIGHGNVRWILSLGSRNRRHRCGLQYCPSCFEEGIPYFRYRWRFAWHTGCLRHGNCLLSRCMQCHTPIQPQLLKPPAIDCSVCHACGENLGSGLHNRVCLPGALQLQSVADHEMNFGSAAFAAGEWFEYAYLLLGVLRYAMRSQSGPTLRMLSSLGVEIEPHHQICSGLPLELLEVSERMQLLALLAPLVAHPPVVVVQAITEYKLPISVFGTHVSKTFIGTVARSLISATTVRAHKQYTFSKSRLPADRFVVEREWLRLQRKIFAYGHL